MVAVAVLLGACGGGGGGGDDETQQDAASSDGGDDSGGSDAGADEYAAALADDMRADDQAPALDGTQLACFTHAVVDAVGADRMAAAGISPDEFVAADNVSDLDVDVPASAVDDLGQGIAACDIAGLLEDDVVLSSFVDEFGFELAPEGAACLKEQMDDQALADAVAEVFLNSSGDSLETIEVNAVVACPDVAAAVFISQAPTQLSPDGEQCITAFVKANPELIQAAFSSTGGDRSASQEFGTQLAVACPEVASQVAGQ
jgi:hypothetical protein